MSRLRLTAAMLVLAALAGCSADRNAVDPTAGGGLRFVSGDRTVRVLPVRDRPRTTKVTGTLLDGRPFDLADYAGTVVVINFWASWCAPCRAEAGELESVYQQTKSSGVQFIGVNAKDVKSAALAFQRNAHTTYPSVFDPSGRVALRFRSTPPSSIPATIVIDRAGRVAALFRKPLLAEDLLPVVRKIAAERS